MSSKIQSRTDLINQAQQLAGQIAATPNDTSNKAAATSQTGAEVSTDTVEGPKVADSNVAHQAQELERVLSQIRGMSLGSSYEAVVTALPKRALAAIQALHEGAAIAPGQSPQQAFRDVTAKLYEAEAGVRSQINKDAGELDELFSSDRYEPLWKAIDNQGSYTTRQGYINHLENEASRAAADKGTWLHKVAPEPVDTAAVDREIETAQKLAGELQQAVRERGFPDSLAPITPFANKNESFEALHNDGRRNFSIIANPKHYTWSTVRDAVAPILAQRRAQSGALREVKRELAALQGYVRSDVRPNASRLQALRDQLIAKSAPELLSEIGDAVHELSLYAADEEVAKGELTSVTDSNSSTTFQSEGKVNFRKSTRGGVEKNPLFSNKKSGHSSTQSHSETRQEYLLPASTHYRFDVEPPTDGLSANLTFPESRRSLVRGEEGFVIDRLLQIGRLTEALSFSHPGSPEEAKALAWLRDSTAELHLAAGTHPDGYKTVEEKPTEIDLRMARLRDDLRDHASELSAESGYGPVIELVKQELASPLQRA